MLAACSYAGMVFVTLPRAKSPTDQKSFQSLGRKSKPTSGWEALPTIYQSSDESPLRGMGWLGAGILAGIILAVSTTPPALAQQPGYEGTFSIKAARHLDLCKNVKKFHKRYKDQAYQKEKRQKKYQEGSAIWNRYTQKVASIRRRETVYGERFCGKADGLPRIIATGEPGIKGGVVIPAFMFLYTAGWIGWAGRSYLTRTRSVEKEILIDAPLALTCMASGFAWPVVAWQEIVNGEMVVPDSEIYRGIH